MKTVGSFLTLTKNSEHIASNVYKEKIFSVKNVVNYFESLNQPLVHLPLKVTYFFRAGVKIELDENDKLGSIRILSIWIVIRNVSDLSVFFKAT